MLTTTSKTASRQGSSIAAGHEHLCGMRHCDTMKWNEYFDYCPTTGVLRWKTHRPLHHFKTSGSSSRWHKLWGGKIAASMDSHGHLQVCVNGKHTMVHRIAWEIVNGPIPIGMDIDHINGVRNDNRLSNLRVCTRSQNMANAKRRSNSTSQLKGVSFCPKTKKWRAQIQHMGAKRSLGYYSTKEDAHGAYIREAISTYGQFARTE